MKIIKKDEHNKHCIHYDNALIFVHSLSDEKVEQVVSKIIKALIIYEAV